MEQFEVTPADRQTTIAAVSTPHGVGGIAVIRVSGPDAIRIVGEAWGGVDLASVKSHTAHLGRYVDTYGEALDQAVATVFRGPASFTGEDVVELSVHGSQWIQREILSDLIRRGASAAAPGEFTQRAFLNRRIDLAQAEGVADLISSSSRAAHRIAMSQTRGDFSSRLQQLHDSLVEFASLLELELDFSEEDVEFADRSKLLELAQGIHDAVRRLADSYAAGCVIKNGVPVAIAGVPNAGKSSLLNLLLGDDKAIVSDIPGTTRDSIEDTREIDGVLFRFIDTAGLRDTSDTVENLGIERARKKMADARIIIWMIDSTSQLEAQYEMLAKFRSENRATCVITLVNKADLLSSNSDQCRQSIRNSTSLSSKNSPGGIAESPESDESADLSARISPECIADQPGSGEVTDLITRISPECIADQPGSGEACEDDIITFSTKTFQGLTELLRRLHHHALGETDMENDVIITNARHYESLISASQSIKRAIDGLKNGISADFVAQDIRETLHHLGTITGTITTDILLHNIFSRFCIGK